MSGAGWVRTFSTISITTNSRILFKEFCLEAAIQRCSQEKVFWKHVANVQENTHAEVIEITLRDGRSPVNLLNIFRTPFYKNTSGWLLVLVVTKPKLFLLLSSIHICGFFKQKATSRLHTHLRKNCIFRIVLLSFTLKKFSVRTYIMF